MSTDIKKLMDGTVTWQEISVAGNISAPGSAAMFKTGDWRSEAPMWIEEKCKQCMLCYPVCPDSAIPVAADGKRRDFDFDFCKGCMVCMQVCPFKAIEREDV